MIKKFFVFITLLSGSIAAVLQPLSDVPVIEVYKNGSTRFSYVCGALPDTSKTDKVLLLNRREGQWFEKTFTCKCPGSTVTESGVRAVGQFVLSLKKKASFSTFFKCSWDSSKSFVIQVVFDAKETDVVIYASAKKCPKYLLEFAKAAILQRSWFALNKYKTAVVIALPVVFVLTRVYLLTKAHFDNAARKKTIDGQQKVEPGAPAQVSVDTANMQALIERRRELEQQLRGVLGPYEAMMMSIGTVIGGELHGMQARELTGQESALETYALNTAKPLRQQLAQVLREIAATEVERTKTASVQEVDSSKDAACQFCTCDIDEGEAIGCGHCDTMEAFWCKNCDVQSGTDYADRPVERVLATCPFCKILITSRILGNGAVRRARALANIKIRRQKNGFCATCEKNCLLSGSLSPRKAAKLIFFGSFDRLYKPWAIGAALALMGAHLFDIRAE